MIALLWRRPLGLAAPRAGRLCLAGQATGGVFEIKGRSVEMKPERKLRPLYWVAIDLFALLIVVG